MAVPALCFCDATDIDGIFIASDTVELVATDPDLVPASIDSLERILSATDAFATHASG
jgi:hypothetical protein